MANLLFYISNGKLDIENHTFEVDPPADYKPKRIKRGNDKVEVNINNSIITISFKKNFLFKI